MSKEKNQGEGGYRISPVQEGLWVRTDGMQSRGALETRVALLLPSSLSDSLASDRLDPVLHGVLSRYEILRSDYTVEGGRRFPLQLPRKESSISLRSTDQIWSSPRLSVALKQDESERPVLHLSAPAFIADPHTLLLIASELFEALQETGTPTQEETLQYAQYAEWSRQFVEEPEEGAEEYWSRALDLPVIDGLLTDQIETLGYESEIVMLETDLIDVMNRIAKRLQIDSGDAPIILWSTFLQNLGRGEQIIVHVDVEGREIEELAGVVGPVAQTLPFLLESLSEEIAEESLESRLRQVAGSLEEFRGFAESPPDFSGISSVDRAGLCVGVEVIDVARFTSLEPLSAHSTTLPLVAKLSVLVAGEEGRSLALHYDSSRLDQASASIIAEMFERWVRGVGTADRSAPLQSVAMLDRDRSASLFRRVGAPDLERRRDLLQRIEERVRENPEEHVVQVGEVRYTCGELDARALSIAVALRDAGVSSGEIVPFLLDRSFDAVATILGVLKLGAAFLPIDPTLPLERIDFMVEQSGAKVVVVASRGEPCARHAPRVLALEEVVETDATLAPVLPSPESPAYVIYTSGSTGDPKGCVIRRRNISSYVSWALGYYEPLCGATGVWPLFTSLSFDLTLTSIFLSLCGRGSLHIYPSTQELPEVLHDIFSDSSAVDIVKMTPGQTSLIPALGLKRSTVKGVILGGEQLHGAQVASLRELNHEITLFNEYGPTETTIGCTVAEVVDRKRISIGRPIDGTEIYLLDEEGNPVPPYALGEIWVAGEGTGAGYLGREEITEQRFRDDLPVTSGATAYRTGDLGWRYPNGTLVYVGRNDNQVKVRGYRIEPDEVKSRLLEVPGVQDGVVLPVEMATGDLELVAYFVAQDNQTVTEEVMREQLAASLPIYMIPHFFVRVEAIPLTINGKPDREQLPDPRIEGKTSESLPLETETERWLAALWGDLLNADVVGRDEDFFRLGGHSLLAMRMIAQVNLEKGVDMKIRTLFEHPTIEELASVLDRSERKSKQDIRRGEEMLEFELSDAQRRLWVLEQMEEVGSTYHIYGAYDVQGDLDTEILESAFTRLLQRHSTLRTTFPVREGHPVQRVEVIDRFDLQVVDLRAVNPDERVERVDAVSRRVLEDPFNLEVDLPVRAAVVRFGEQEQRLLVSMHHMVSDGWSVNIMIRELVEFYEAGLSGRDVLLPELTLGYADVVAHQQEQLSGEEGERLRSYWLQQLADASPLDLPIDLPRSRRRSYRGENVQMFLEADRLQGLERIGAETGTSLFMVLVSLLDLLFYRYSGETDITIGTVIAGRDHAGLESQIGFYVNTLPIRVRLESGWTFGRLLEEVRDVLLGAYDHQAYPFDRLVDELGVEREVGRSPLFDTFIVLQNPENEELSFGDAELREHPYENRSNAYDLAFNCELIDGGLTCTISYSTELFLRQRIENLVAHFQSLINEVLAEGGIDRSISALNLYPPTELLPLVERWSRTETFEGRLEQDMVEQIDHLARISPENQAICSDSLNMNYGELRRRSNGVAGRLIEETGEKKGAPIVVLLPRCGELPLLLLSIRKAGGIYVPIDIDFPRERIERMLSESGASIVITNREGMELLGEGREEVEVILLEEIARLEREDAPAVARDIDDVVALIFTSGSTGVPKGVQMHARGVNNAALSKLREVRPSDDDFRGLVFASPSFDASLITMLVPLLAGGVVVLFDRETIESRERFLERMEESKVTYAILPPSYLATLERAEMPSLRALTTAGESPLLGDALHYARDLDYINAYGPAECSICVSLYHVDPGVDYTGGIPIGRELPNTLAIVVDGHRNVLPEGIDGELWVAGVGIGAGYLREEQTAEAFLEHPSLPGKRFYRTGDVVRRGFDGNLLFRGRVDNQVKIRGHRVEPSETALALTDQEGISDAAVLSVPAEYGVLMLVAWVVRSREGVDDLDLLKVRAELAEHLPSYMMPSRFFAIDALPLSPTDKIDLAALEKMTLQRMEERTTGNRREASGEEERVLCAAVADVLGLERVSPDDNYFMLGGDSIRAIQVTWRLREAGYKIEVRDIFAHPLLGEAATTMAQVDHSDDPEIVVGPVPLHPIQRWFFDGVEREYAHHFNQSTLLKWRSVPVDMQRLREALQEVIGRHDMLRARFLFSAGERPQQILERDADIVLEEVEVDAEGFSSELLRGQEGFDLTTGPLFRTRVIRVESGEERTEYIHFIAHHLVVDVVSWHVILEEIFAFYEERGSGRPRRGSSYSAWVTEMQNFASDPDGAEVIDYWQRKSRSLGAPSLLEVNREKPNRIVDTTIATITLPRELTASLVSEVHHVYATEVRDLLLCALGRALRGMTGGKEVVIALEGHGRDIDRFRELDVSRTVGWFTSLYPVLLRGGDLEGEDLGYDIKQAKEAIRSLPLNGAGYGMTRYFAPEGHAVKDIIGEHAQVTLNYLGLEGGSAGDASFEIIPENPLNPYHPEISRTMEIDILASISNGELSAALMHNPERLRPGLVEEIGEMWLQSIEEIVTHLLGVTESELTPSDVDLDGLSIDDLDDILSRITAAND